MDAKEYLSQVYRLNDRINVQVREIARLRQLATSLSSTAISERVMTSKSNEPPFVRHIDKLVDMERDTNEKIDRLIALRDEISNAIDAITNEDDRLVFQMRYIDGYSWSEIAEELGIAESTVRRWHERSLSEIIVPEAANSKSRLFGEQV